MAVKSVEGKGGAAIGFIQRAKVNAFPGTPGLDQKEGRLGGGEAMKVDGRGDEMKGRRGGKRGVWR